MAFASRYEGNCNKCGGRILVGQFITWSRREKKSAAHYDCSNPDAKPPEATPTAAPTVPDISAAVAEALKAMGITGTLPTAVSISTPAAPIPAAPTSLSKVPKDNAPWWELLEAIYSAFGKEYIRVLVIGPPGTGKTRTCMILSKSPYETTMTEGMGVEELTGMFHLIKGETVWKDAPPVRAMKEGSVWVCNEADHHATEVGSVFYALLDDNPAIMQPSGERVVATSGYGVLATTNSNVTALPEAVLDRFEVILQATIPHPAALVDFEKNQRAVVENHFRNLDGSPWRFSRKTTVRTMKAFRKMLPILGAINAAKVVFGEAGKEVLSAMSTAAR